MAAGEARALEAVKGLEAEQGLGSGSETGVSGGDGFNFFLSNE